MGVYGHGGSGRETRGSKAHAADWPGLMRMPWASPAGCAQAIPPTYTEYIAHQWKAGRS